MDKILKDEAEMRRILQERSKVKGLSELLVQFHRDNNSSASRPKWSPLKLDFRRTPQAPTLTTLGEMARQRRDIRPPSRNNSDHTLKRLDRTSSTDIRTGRVPKTKSQKKEVSDLMFWARRTSSEEANVINNYQENGCVVEEQQIRIKASNISGKQNAAKPKKKYPKRSNVEISRPAWNSSYKLDPPPKPEYLHRTPVDKKRNVVSKASMISGKSSNVRPRISNRGPQVSGMNTKGRGSLIVTKSADVKDRHCHFSRRLIVVTSSSGESLPGLAYSTDILRPAEAKHNLLSKSGLQKVLPSPFKFQTNTNRGGIALAKYGVKSRQNFIEQTLRQVRRNKPSVLPKPAIPERSSWASSSRAYQMAQSNGLGDNGRTSRLRKQSVQMKSGGHAVQKGISSFVDTNEEPHKRDSSVEVIWRAGSVATQQHEPGPEDVSTYDPIETNILEYSVKSFQDVQYNRIYESVTGWFEQTKNEFSGEKLDVPSPSNQPVENLHPGVEWNEEKRMHPKVKLLTKVRNVFKLTPGDDDPSGSRISSEVESSPSDDKKGCFRRFFSPKKSNPVVNTNEVPVKKNGLLRRISKGLTNFFNRRNRVAPTTQNI